MTQPVPHLHELFTCMQLVAVDSHEPGSFQMKVQSQAFPGVLSAVPSACMQQPESKCCCVYTTDCVHPNNVAVYHYQMVQQMSGHVSICHQYMSPTYANGLWGPDPRWKARR